MTLELNADVRDAMVAHCLNAYPLEGCGLLAAVPGQPITHCYPTGNVAASSRVYTIDPRDHLKADIDAEANGAEIIGVFHSHTHTPAYPSPTDVEQAPVAEWHYVLVSFEDAATPSVRSYRIIDAGITEEPVKIIGAPAPAR